MSKVSVSMSAGSASTVFALVDVFCGIDVSAAKLAVAVQQAD